MGFWEEHARREAAQAPPESPSAQNAPTECGCGHVGTDVLLGVCDACAKEWGA